MCTLSKRALSLWGKKEINEDGEEMWLPLVAHLLDTKNTIKWLYNHFLNSGQRQILLNGFYDINTVQNMIEFLGYIHDIGKATPAFQVKASYTGFNDLDEELIWRLIDTGFDELKDFADENTNTRISHAKAGETILEKRGLNETLGAIVGGHHGMPLSMNFDFEIDNERNEEEYLEYDEDQEKWADVQDELINYGLKQCGFNDLRDLPEVTETQAVILNGLVIMADWLASSFPLIDIDELFPPDIEKRFEIEIGNWGRKIHKWEPDSVFDVDTLYKKRFNFSPRELQHIMSQAIENSIDPGIIIIEAPMGLGKTEIALIAVEQIADNAGRNGLFFGLPTQATTNAMFSRVEDWLKNIAQDNNEQLMINLMHSKAQFNKKFSKLARIHADNIYSDNSEDDANDQTDNTVVVNTWFSGKKSILADFSIGTIDQLLLMGLKQKHLSLRHLGLSGKIVVIDEIHAYDTYMNSYLTKALEWLGSYHVPVIALSATLPIERRQGLINAYARGKYGKEVDSEQTGNLTRNYPMLSLLDGKKLKQFNDFDLKDIPHKTISVIKLNADDNDLVKKIGQKVQQGGVAGVVVNTVKRAQTLAKIAEEVLPDDVKILVLHSAFTAPDREMLEEKLESLIGKNGDRPEKLIVIGTQVLEQSLDIDFDVLFTDIAPIDLLLQRLGRMQRHAIKRPQNLVKPQLYVMGINKYGDYGDANEVIYDRYLLKKTDAFLPDKIVLPNQISGLVQKVYDEQTNKTVDNIEDDFNLFKQKQKEEKAKAGNFQIDDPNSRDNLHGWLDFDNPNVNVSDTKAHAAVRDTDETIAVILLKQVDGQNFLVDGRSIEELPEDKKDQIIAQQLIRLPHAITLDIDKSIKKLEKIYNKSYYWFNHDSWLAGLLVLPLNDRLEAEFNGYKIKYDSQLGLSYEKLDN